MDNTKLCDLAAALWHDDFPNVSWPPTNLCDPPKPSNWIAYYETRAARELARQDAAIDDERERAAAVSLDNESAALERVTKMVESAVLAEREACAVAVETMYGTDPYGEPPGPTTFRGEAAAVIRARK